MGKKSFQQRRNDFISESLDYGKRLAKLESDQKPGKDRLRSYYLQQNVLHVAPESISRRDRIRMELKRSR